MNTELDSLYQTVTTNQYRTWVDTGELLFLVSANDYWKKTAFTFTDWVEILAKKIGKKPAVLWRSLSVYRDYLEITPNINMVEKLPEKPDPNLSPESLEIFFKLHRAMPKEDFIHLSQRVFYKRDISRAELRDTWNQYKATLDGRTARGIGVHKPKLDIKDEHKNLKALEAKILTKLTQTNWFSGENVLSHQLFTNITPIFMGYSQKSITEEEKHNKLKKIRHIDAVSVVKRIGAPIEFHGVELCIKSSISKHKTIDDLLDYFDYFWVIIANKNDECHYDYMEGIGLITIINDNFVITRDATLNLSSQKKTGDLAKSILNKVLFPNKFDAIYERENMKMLESFY